MLETNENLHASCGDVCDKIAETQSSGNETIDAVEFILFLGCTMVFMFVFCFMLKRWNKN